MVQVRGRFTDFILVRYARICASFPVFGLGKSKVFITGNAGRGFLRGTKKKDKKRLVRCCRNKNKYYLCSRFGRETVRGVKKETTSSLKILEKGQASIKKQFLRDLSGPKDIQDL
jgi:hypothetical protein